MLSKRSLSLSAALLLSAFGGVVRAASARVDSDFSAAESVNQDSGEYGKRTFGPHSPSNEEINAAETGNPDSVDNRRQMPTAGDNWAKNWEALEVGNPDFR